MLRDHKLSFLAAVIFSVLAPYVLNVNAQADDADMQSTVASPLEPLRAGISADQLFLEVLAHNDARTSALVDYLEFRTYELADSKGKMRAEEVGRMEFHAPDKKAFVVTSEKGSSLIRRLALNPLIASEIEAAAGKQHHDTSITPSNYKLELIGEQQVGASHCIVAHAVPKRSDRYLFEGKIWIDDKDYAIVRIEGQPAKKLSFWIERADFVREYQKIHQFWLPRRDKTFVAVRLYGRKVLTIDHQDYVVNDTLNKVALRGSARNP